MSSLCIRGGIPLQGSIFVHGSKNMTLPILCACLLIPERVVIDNCPCISDVDETLEMLRELGAIAKREGQRIECDCTALCSGDIRGELTRRNRMSILMFGCVLSRLRKGYMEYPGGCAIGTRPVDMHVSMFRTLGAEIYETEDGIGGKTEGFSGAEIAYTKRSVGATENALLCAVLAKGKTTIRGAAREPEVEGLCDFLRAAGARIYWDDVQTLCVDGVECLHGVHFTMASDRIVAGTYLAATAITGGCCELIGAPVSHMKSILRFFASLGCGFVCSETGIYMEAPLRLCGGIKLETGPYPEFPTDMQPFAVALMAVAHGGGELRETVFEKRFTALREMNRLGAELAVDPPYVHAMGNACLRAASVKGTDLRGSAALAIAALAAQGESRVGGMEYIRRGYENFDGNLRRLGADCIVVTEE